MFFVRFFLCNVFTNFSKKHFDGGGKPKRTKFTKSATRYLKLVFYYTSLFFEILQKIEKNPDFSYQRLFIQDDSMNGRRNQSDSRGVVRGRFWKFCCQDITMLNSLACVTCASATCVLLIMSMYFSQ